MAYSNVIYAGDGVTTNWAVPFPYLDPAHVSVDVNGVAVAFTWVGAATVQLSPAPATAAVILIARNSNRQARLAHYQDAQVLDETSMDNDALQLFYVAQEAFDAVSSAATGGDMRRAMNLSDVNSIAQALLNLGAVAKAGDTMTGPLHLSGPPIAPNDAASKSYVDSLLAGFAGSGVTSFNLRSGAVSLLSADITASLGFTPVNKAGDSMLGALILAADPSVPLGAATKQYVDAHSGTGGSTGEYVFGVASPTYAAAVLNKGQTANTSDRAGAANLTVTRSGGTTPMVSFQNTYNVTVPNTGVNGDIGMGANMVGVSGPFLAFSAKAFGPRNLPANTWQAYGGSFGVNERQADQGFKRDRTGNFTMSLLIAPTSGDVGDGPVVAYNTSYGIGFTAATPLAVTQRIWNPLFFELDCTVPNGIHAEHRGGSVLANAPFCAIDIRDYFTCGIDMRSANFLPAQDNTAIWLAQGQAIHYGPLQRVYVDPTGNLTFYDAVAGTHTLTSLGGGIGTNILPLANIWTGTNRFSGATGSTPAMVSGNIPLLGAMVERAAPTGGSSIQAAFQVNTVTLAGTTSSEWNALFRLDNYATGGNNVGMYSQVNKMSSSGPTWAGVFEVRDHADGSGNLYGLEIDLCADGLSAGAFKRGIGLFYGAQTNTFGAGSNTFQTHGLHIAPFVAGRNSLGAGVQVDGYCNNVIYAHANGIAGLRVDGQYSGAALDLSSVTNTPLAIAFAPGSRMHFASGTGNSGNQTYFPGGYVPSYVAAIQVVVDGTTMYIPLSLNHP